VKNCSTFYKNKRPGLRFSSKLLGVSLLICSFHFVTYSQDCPPNLDFEQGNFSGWTCWAGYVAAVNGQNVITLSPTSPIPGRHTVYKANSGILDAFGGFSVNCPNGSGYSIRLGNDLPGTEAEGVSYEFKIPANRNVYSLIYHYAVVFQDPNHEIYQQPRMEIEITNLTDGNIIDCSSFTFIPYGSILPGFFESSNPGSSTPVWCKDWTAVSINLNGMAGKTIRLFFKTADCTFRRHFGYAYIDVNSECTDEFVGATYCADDTSVTVTAPFGYQNYTWYNNNFSQTLGTQQSLVFPSPPARGTTIAVKVTPYDGYGCEDTLYARLIDTLSITANAGRDTFSCNYNPVPIGANSKPGLVHSWSPAAGLSNPNISNPLASPAVATNYVLTTRHDGGGCVDTDTVLVKAAVIDSSLQVIGKLMYCAGYGDSTILIVKPTDSIQWYRDNVPINGAHQTQYHVTKSGTYHAMLFNESGCSIATVKKGVTIEIPKPGITYPVQYAVVDLPITLQARQFGISALWTPGNNLDNRSSYTPAFQSHLDQLYTVQINTAAGCVTVDTQLVKIVPHVDMYVPSAFTPNNDGLNDFLRPTLMGIKELHYFRIYNRWGQLLFESKTERPGWNGIFKGTAQPTQVVVWIAEGLGVDGRIYTRKGTSTLVR